MKKVTYLLVFCILLFVGCSAYEIIDVSMKHPYSQLLKTRYSLKTDCYLMSESSGSDYYVVIPCRSPWFSQNIEELSKGQVVDHHRVVELLPKETAFTVENVLRHRSNERLSVYELMIDVSLEVNGKRYICNAVFLQDNTSPYDTHPFFNIEYVNSY